MLEDCAVALHRIGKRPALGHSVAEGLLAVDIPARADGSKRGQDVPVIWRSDENGIDVVAVNQVPEVGVG